jgi:hypothetical protein
LEALKPICKLFAHPWFNVPKLSGWQQIVCPLFNVRNANVKPGTKVGNNFANVAHVKLHSTPHVEPIRSGFGVRTCGVNFYGFTHFNTADFNFSIFSKKSTPQKSIPTQKYVHFSKILCQPTLKLTTICTNINMRRYAHCKNMEKFVSCQLVHNAALICVEHFDVNNSHLPITKDEQTRLFFGCTYTYEPIVCSKVIPTITTTPYTKVTYIRNYFRTITYMIFTKKIKNEQLRISDVHNCRYLDAQKPICKLFAHPCQLPNNAQFYSSMEIFCKKNQ